LCSRRWLKPNLRNLRINPLSSPWFFSVVSLDLQRHIG
jgi:hypothetical protein